MLAFLSAVEGDHHAAVRLRTDGVGRDAAHVLQGGVDDVALIGVHGLERHAAAVLEHLARDLAGEILQALLALGAVVLRVDIDAHALVAPGVDGVVRQLLDRVERLAAAADELAELLADEDGLIAALLRLIDLDAGIAVHVLQQTLEEGDDALGVLVGADAVRLGGGLLCGGLRLFLGLFRLCGRGGLGGLLRPVGLLFRLGLRLFLRDGGRGRLGVRIRHAHLRRAAADAQKAALRALENLDGHIVAILLQLLERLADGLFLSLARYVDKTHRQNSLIVVVIFAVGTAAGIGPRPHAPVLVRAGLLLTGLLFLVLLAALVLGLLAAGHFGALAVVVLLRGLHLLIAALALFALLLRLLAVEDLVEVLVERQLLNQGEAGVGNPVHAQSGGQDIAHPQRHERHHEHHDLRLAVGGVAAGVHGDERHEHLNAGGDDRQEQDAPHRPAAVGEAAQQARRRAREVKTEEAVVQVDQVVELAGEVGPVLVDELGQIDLLIGGRLPAGRGFVAEARGKVGDLADDIRVDVHQKAQRRADDVVQGDEDGEGDERPQAAGHRVHTLARVELCHLLLLALAVVGEAGLDILDLALHPVHAEHALLALELEGQQHELHHEGKEDQRNAVGARPTVEQAGQPRERHTDIISELCKHGVIYLRYLSWGKTRCFFKGRGRTRPCGRGGTAKSASAPESRPWPRHISRPPRERTPSRWGYSGSGGERGAKRPADKSGSRAEGSASCVRQQSELAETAQIMPLELAVRRLGGAHARDDNDVVPRGHLFAVQAINLPQAAAYAVAHDGMAELGADRHAETRLAAPVFLTVHHQTWTDRRSALAVDAAELVVFLYCDSRIHLQQLPPRVLLHRPKGTAVFPSTVPVRYVLCAMHLP